VLKLKSPELIPGLTISTFSSFHPGTAIVTKYFIPLSSPLSSKILNLSNADTSNGDVLYHKHPAERRIARTRGPSGNPWVNDNRLSMECSGSTLNSFSIKGTTLSTSLGKNEIILTPAKSGMPLSRSSQLPSFAVIFSLSFSGAFSLLMIEWGTIPSKLRIEERSSLVFSDRSLQVHLCYETYFFMTSSTFLTTSPLVPIFPRRVRLYRRHICLY